MASKKVGTVADFVIALEEDGHYSLYFKDDWSLGEGFRYPEMDGFASPEQARGWAKSY